MTLEPNTTVSHFRILSSIGKGGMGEVYLAQDKELDRKVAIKFLNESLSKDEDKVNRFVQEAKAASALNHPNILTVYEIGTWEGTRYIATEHIEGETLRDVLKRKEPVPLNRILKIGIQIAEALSAAHEAGIAHRDIKPENIMVRKDGYIKVLDFGLAKLVEKQNKDADISLEGETKALVKTNPGVVMGTANYMSPEQAQGKGTDPRTDLWSLGVVLYEMLAGRVPFEGKTVNHTIVSILETEPKLLENVPDELQRIVRKTLAKERGMRYQTSGDLVVDLKNLHRDLDIKGELERSIVPVRETESGSSGETQSQPQVTGDAADAYTQYLASTSSLEYAVTQAKSHKFAAGMIAVLLVAAIAAISYFTLFSDGPDQIESIAVMPFVNESGDEDVEYLSDGMTETLIGSLSKLPNLQVKPRSSVFRYKGKETDVKTIGRDLNVQAILNGRVVQRGDQLTLSLELIDVQKEVVIWSERYNRKQSELVTLQSEIARDLSSKLKSKLSGEDEANVTKTSTTNPEAYQAYLKGRYFWNKRDGENLGKAIEQFKSAADRDPNFALAYVGLGDCYALINEYTDAPLSETLPQAKTYAERAIAIDSQLGEPHATLGLVYKDQWRWKESEREYKKAIELSPNYATAYQWYSILLNTLGRFDEAAVMIKRAYELDPLSMVIGINMAGMYQKRGEYDESIKITRKMIELDPNSSFAYRYLALSLLKQGRNAEAIENLEKAAEISDRFSGSIADLGYGYGVTGQREKAIGVIKELESNYAKNTANGYQIASAYMGLGDKEKAFEWLEKAFQDRAEVSRIRREIHFDSIRDDPRYKDLMRRLGLPD